MKMAVEQKQNPASRVLNWAQYATYAAICVSSFLIAIKIVAWLKTDSVAVLGSLADSMIDLFASVIAAAAVRYASLPPDDNHRFGHQKAEALTALLQVALIASSAALVAWESAQRLLSPVALENSAVAIAVLGISVVLTVGLAAFQTFAIRKSKSLIIEGDRAHYLGDTIAGLGLMFAIIIGSAFAIPQADAFAGLGASLFLAYAAWSVIREVIPQLMDEEIPVQERECVERLLDEDPDILGYHALRTRRAGGQRFIQLDIQIDPNLSFREAHDISDRIELQIEALFDAADVIVHADPAGEAREEDRILSVHSKSVT